MRKTFILKYEITNLPFFDMKKVNTGKEEAISNYYKWSDLQPKMQQYLIDHKDAAGDIVTEVMWQCRVS